MVNQVTCHVSAQRSAKREEEEMSIEIMTEETAGDLESTVVM